METVLLEWLCVSTGCKEQCYKITKKRWNFYFRVKKSCYTFKELLDRGPVEGWEGSEEDLNSVDLVNLRVFSVGERVNFEQVHDEEVGLCESESRES